MHFRTTPILFTLLATLANFTAMAQTSQRGDAQEQVFVPAGQFDTNHAAALGIRKLASRHLQLFTDLPPQPAIDVLPRVFDLAVRQWAEYFDIPAAQVSDWQVTGYLIDERAKFATLGLLPQRNPGFVNGFANGNQIWLVEQPSDYYRRHLLLHEGVHSFMNSQLGGTGPGWYMEGMAELLATHRWQDGQLSIRHFPSNRQEVPMWGRIKLVREAYRNGKALSLRNVLAIDNRRALGVEAYAWCWSLCKFLDSHPRLGSKFRQLPDYVDKRDFNRRFLELYRNDWSDLTFEWEAFVAALDYGYDMERMSMVHQAVEPLEQSANRSIAADRGWQSTGWLLKAGKKYDVKASGRYQIAEDKQPWPCEPGGVTIRYHAGQPLGMLLGMLRPVEEGQGQPLQEIAIGLQTTITPQHDSVLYLRVNDSPAELSDNRGALEVRVRVE